MLLKMCSSRKYPHPPMDGHWKSEGLGVSKATIFKGKYEAKQEFPEGWGENIVLGM